ncbi:TetR/AcrR family transcriptional regulator [Nocardiopsis sp. EMB25]|uniref:TetR/AcrR family transcriptional regulator n=1 Tax=Nocardiopsis sp. EMB25 TaxID=2835867 RepID=UPI002284A18F|nr:TetR/AcrR family transcriptional regulator [Nocardiopsis sp. EMB25]MCY9786796.1 TetR/AcrR family transcriptional regulator [Nocardiopsis sp. EMB25]
MTSDTPAPGSSRPGGRTARNTAAVLQATLDELGEHGHHTLTVERVAARSGVHKATVYRRWGGVDGLLAAALEWSAARPWEPERTGSLYGDLLALTEAVARGFTDAPEKDLSTASIAAALDSPTVARALRVFMADRHERAAVVVTEAVGRGEIPADTDSLEVVRAAVAPIYYRLLVSREPVAPTDLRRAARTAAEAAAQGLLAAQDSSG